MVLCLILIVTLEPLKRLAYCSGLGADMLKEIILILMLMLMPMLMLMLMIMLMLMLRPGGGHVEGDQGETGEESQRDTTAKVESHDFDKSENQAFDVQSRWRETTKKSNDRRARRRR